MVRRAKMLVAARRQDPTKVRMPRMRPPILRLMQQQQLLRTGILRLSLSLLDATTEREMFECPVHRHFIYKGVVI